MFITLTSKARAILFVVGLVTIGLLLVLHVVVNKNKVRQTAIPTPDLNQKEELGHKNTQISINFSTDFEPKGTSATYDSSTHDLTLNFLQPDCQTFMPRDRPFCTHISRLVPYDPAPVSALLAFRMLRCFVGNPQNAFPSAFVPHTLTSIPSSAASAALV